MIGVQRRRVTQPEDSFYAQEPVRMGQLVSLPQACNYLQEKILILGQALTALQDALEGTWISHNLLPLTFLSITNLVMDPTRTLCKHFT